MQFAWLRRWSGRRGLVPIAGCLAATAGLGLVLAIDRLPAAERGLSQGGDCDKRISVAFASVPDNPIALAVPLTRRALSERAAQRKAQRVAATDGAIHAELDDSAEFDDVAPGRDVVADDGGPEDGGGSDGADPTDGGPNTSKLAAGGPDGGEVDEGDASDDDEAVRLPRPRPGEAVPVRVADIGPDLIAKASLPASAPVPKPVAPPEPPIADVAEDSPPDLVASAVMGEPAVATGVDATPEPVAAPACQPIDKLADADGDFARNRAALSAPGYCVHEERFKERRRDWTVQTVDSGRPGPVWAVMHDDEALSFDTAVWGLTTYGGRLVTVETGGERNRDGVDPNRNFADAKVGCTDLEDGGAPLFTAALAGAMAGRRPILALHNNSGGPVATGGLGHVSLDNVSKSMRVIESPHPDGPLAGPHNLVLLAARNVESAGVAARARRLSEAGMNVVIEPVREAGSDCSLSNYAVLTGRPDYFNVTVGTGEADRQRRMIAAVLATERLAPPARTAAR